MQSTVDKVVQMSAELLGNITSFMKRKTESFAAATGIPPENEHLLELMNNFDSVSQPFENLQAVFKRKRYFKQSDFFLSAQPISLDIGYFPRTNRLTGNVMQTFGDVTFQYVSIVKRIRLLLENTDLLKIASDYKPSEDGLMRDFHDGYFCKNNALLSAHSTLRIVLYIDDFEVSNPLGPKATFFVFVLCAGPSV